VEDIHIIRLLSSFNNYKKKLHNFLHDHLIDKNEACYFCTICETINVTPQSGGSNLHYCITPTSDIIGVNLTRSVDYYIWLACERYMSNKKTS